MPRGPNKKHYRYHIHGSIADIDIDCKCTSFNEFLNMYGGDKTPLGLHRRKLHRLRSGYYNPNGRIAKMWKDLNIDEIRETVNYVRKDEDETNSLLDSNFKEMTIDENGVIVDIKH